MIKLEISNLMASLEIKEGASEEFNKCSFICSSLNESFFEIRIKCILTPHLIFFLNYSYV
ncbi:hypothetical protein DSECCO2_528040 [anaerobic digester metagenome]